MFLGGSASNLIYLGRTGRAGSKEVMCGSFEGEGCPRITGFKNHEFSKQYKQKMWKKKLRFGQYVLILARALEECT
jgi:hypothetical protein